MALNLVESQTLGEEGPDTIPELIEATRAEALIECVPQNIRSGEPALSFMRAALDAGVHVITTNKAPIVLGYRDLRHRAAKSKTAFRFEATVLDGLPLFAFLAQLRHTGIRKIRGVLNATSSVVLESVALGSTRSRGLARAQAQGIAEADSVLDLDGWDAAAKSALLANVWMGGALRVVDVARTGIDTVKDVEVERAQQAGAKFRLVAEIERYDDGHIRASVEPFALEGGDPLYGLRGGQGGIVVYTDQGHEHAFLQQTHGLDDAAYGIMQDGWAIVEQAPEV